MSYDLWKSEYGNPYLEEEEGCICAGVGNRACPVHDPGWFRHGKEIRNGRVILAHGKSYRVVDDRHPQLVCQELGGGTTAIHITEVEKVVR